MRPAFWIGLIFIALGGYVLLSGGGNVKTRDDLVKIGDVKVSTTENHPIPSWAGAIAIVIGLPLAVAGARRK